MAYSYNLVDLADVEIEIVLIKRKQTEAGILWVLAPCQIHSSQSQSTAMVVSKSQHIPLPVKHQSSLNWDKTPALGLMLYPLAQRQSE